MSGSNGRTVPERCSACGARNVPDADWCSQCYAGLGPEAGSVASKQPGPIGSTAAGPPAPRGVSAGGDGDDPTAATQRDIRDVGGGIIEWRCAACEGWTGLHQASCEVCGSPRRGFGDEVTAEPKPVDPTRSLVASLVLPGVGHVLAGAVGSGLARMLLAVMWAGGAFTLLRGGASGTVPGGILLTGAAVLWVATALDIRRLAAGRRDQYLDGRGLAALVVVVTLVLVVASVATAPRGV